jgi:hypothetical protein
LNSVRRFANDISKKSKVCVFTAVFTTTTSPRHLKFNRNTRSNYAAHIFCGVKNSWCNIKKQHGEYTNTKTMSWVIPMIPALIVYGATARKTIDTLVWVNGWVQWIRQPADPPTEENEWQWVQTSTENQDDDPDCFELAA